MNQISQNLIESYLLKYGLLRHQIESFNNFVQYNLEKILFENPTDKVVDYKNKVYHEFNFKNYLISKPIVREFDGHVKTLQPLEASLRKISYCGQVFIDIEHKQYTMIHCDEGHMIYNVDTDQRINQSSPGEEIKVQNAILKLGEIENSLDQYSLILNEVKNYKQVPLFEIPCMVGSLLDNAWDSDKTILDPFIYGGYFIFGGLEKVLVSQERLQFNCPYVFHQEKGIMDNFRLEFRALAENKYRSSSTVHTHLSISKGGAMPQISVHLPHINNYKPPLNYIFRLLGFNKFEDIRRLVLFQSDCNNEHYLDPYIQNAFKHDENDESVENIIDTIYKKGVAKKEPKRVKRIKNMTNTWYNEFMPNTGIDRTSIMQVKKAIDYGYQIYELLNTFYSQKVTKDKIYECTDRDDYCWKRVSTPDQLLSTQVRMLFTEKLRHLNKKVYEVSTTGDVVYVIDYMKMFQQVTTKIERCMNTGFWGSNRSTSSNKTSGISQLMNPMNVISSMSFMRRVNNAINSDGKNPKPRQLHSSSWGVICASETPEGKHCGSIKHLTLLAYIRLGFSPDPILEIMHYQGMIYIEKATFKDLQKGVLVITNGNIRGVLKNHKETLSMLKYLRFLRQLKNIPFDTSIVYNKIKRSLRIITDAGCLLRPVFRTDNLFKIQDLWQQYKDLRHELWDQFMYHGCIEYLSKEEESAMRVATDMSELASNSQVYSHVEIHPSVILGLSVNLTPFPDHNQAPRNTYSGVMTKQGIGWPGLNIRHRYDAEMNLLVYPQKPLTSTFVEKASQVNQLPWGQNIMLAIMSYTGFNQEDSVILNQRSVDNGMFHSFFFRSERQVFNNKGTDKEISEIPDEKITMSKQHGNYNKLTTVTVPGWKTQLTTVDQGETIEMGDAILGKLMLIKDHKDNNIERKKDQSVIYHYDNPATVDKVLATKSKEGLMQVNIRMRSYRVPQIGDKFSSRHGQKGVCSNIMPIEDMPFTTLGMVPDIIINPHCVTGDTLLTIFKDGQYQTITMFDYFYNQVDETQLNYPILTMDPHSREISITHVCQYIESYPTDAFLLAITVIGEREHVLKCTHNHPWMIRQGEALEETRADQIQLGDQVMCFIQDQWSWGTIVNIESCPTEPVFDLMTVSDTHTLVLNGILTHNCIPSRMTIGQLQEMLQGKVSAFKGEVGDCSSFSPISIEDMSGKLTECGFQRYGNETMYNGMTGEQLEAHIFFAPCNYMRLKHMVDDKIHARKDGPRTIMHRQPSDGRAQNGGLKFGEMERDMIISHGAAHVLYDRLVTSSDKFENYYCAQCGLEASGAPIQSNELEKHLGIDPKPYCNVCKTGEHVKTTIIPYTFNNLARSLQACHISLRPQEFEIDDN